MAKEKFFDLFGPNAFLNNYYNLGDGLELQDGATKKRAVLVDDLAENRIVIKGKGLDYDDGEIVAGKITAITFTDADGGRFISMTKLKATAAGFNEAADLSPFSLLEYLLRGKDAITGSGVPDWIQGYGGKNKIHGKDGDDTIFGGKGADRLFGDKGNDTLHGNGGNDRLTGGKGSDTFHFSETARNKVVITDFDAVGGGEAQDYLSIYEGDTFKVKKDGSDVLLKFDDGDTIRLLNVRFKDFDPADDVEFYFYT